MLTLPGIEVWRFDAVDLRNDIPMRIRNRDVLDAENAPTSAPLRVIEIKGNHFAHRRNATEEEDWTVRWQRHHDRDGICLIPQEPVQGPGVVAIDTALCSSMLHCHSLTVARGLFASWVEVVSRE